MNDLHTLKRQQWLRQLSRRYSKNAHGIAREELAYWISERLALVIVAVLVVGVVMEIAR